MTDKAQREPGRPPIVPILINWDTTTTEASLITAIAERYLNFIDHEFPDGGAKLALRMDLTACHLNGCALDLDGFLTASDFAFAHDVQLIQRHIDRFTGRMIGAAHPRFALPETDKDV